MDPIVTSALVGTARQEQVNLATGTPVDALIAALPEGEVERKLLLSAGAWAVYCQAGRQAQHIETLPEPAEPEKLRICSPGVALLLSRLLAGEQPTLLLEALRRLRQASLSLPYALLPQALNTTGAEKRAALFPVLGVRGRWLSQFNPSWGWVRSYLATDETGLPTDAETIWQEGTIGQRVEILRRLRSSDPAKARAWLEGVWKQEKAEARCDLLDTLEVGLGAADEAFLESALDDRASSVRAVAIALLTRLPDSAFSERMRARGSAILKIGKGRLGLELPATLARDWLRDGILEKPPSKFGKRAWWLIQVLAAIPPTFWETRFGLGIDTLLELVAEDKWAVNIIEGWSKAAVQFASSDWLVPLWNWWYMHADRVGNESLTDYTLREQLLQRMPGKVAEEIILALLERGHGGQDIDWQEILPELPQPWSAEFGSACLHIFRKQSIHQAVETQHFNPYSDPWLNSLPTIALALPASCFGEAIHLYNTWKLPEEQTSWQIAHMGQIQQKFLETIQIRQKIDEEIV